MSAPFNLEPEISGIRIEFIPFYFDFKKGAGRKLREILEEKQKMQEKDVVDITRRVLEINKCQFIEIERKGPRGWLWGLYKAGPEERVSISIRGHFK